MAMQTAQVPTGKYWYTQWQNETNPARKQRLDNTYGFTAKYGAQQPQAVTASTTPTTPATATTTTDPNAQPPYFNYTVPGHGNTTQALTDTAGDTWYKTQGGKWRNVRTQMVQQNLPAWQAPAPPPPTPPATPAPVAPAPAPAPVEPINFRSTRDFFGVGESPLQATAVANDGYDQSLFDWRKAESDKALAAWLSANGLTGSGAAGQFNIDATNQLTAEEAARRQEMTESRRNREFTASESAKARQSDIANIDADRSWNQQQLEQERRYRSGTTQWGRIMDVLDRILSLNPMNYAYNATNTSADTIRGLGDALANLEIARGGGGGGGGVGARGPAPTLPPQYGSSQTDFQNSQDWAGLIGNVLGSGLIQNLLR